MKKKIFTIYVIFSLLIGTLFPTKVIASNSDIHEYQEIIEQINSEYNSQFAIIDINAFRNTIYNQLSPSEFKSMLIKDAIAIQKNPLEHEIEMNISIPKTRARNEVVIYPYTVTSGNWKSKVSARIETTFFSTGAPKFIRYIDAGYEWDANSTNYTFRAMHIELESFSSSMCKVKYSGNWVVPATGLSDLTYKIYNVTYRAA